MRRNLGRLACGVILLAAVLWFPMRWFERETQTTLGVTFSHMYARSLGLDWREAFLAIVDDLGVRALRIPVYWSEVEWAHDQYYWGEVDWMVAEAERVGAQVTLVVGAKVPRWPECYIPTWTQRGTEADRRAEQVQFVQETVRRYRHSPAVVRWQVENEPTFPFGECPMPDIGLLQDELNAVTWLDDRPIMLTVSGEWDVWWPSAGTADVLGFSVYRAVWNDGLFSIRYPLPPLYYRLRSWVVRPFVDEVIVSEMQAEPWFPEPAKSAEFVKWYEVFNADDLAEAVSFAQDTGAPEAYLWGAEWWYVLLKHGEPRLWEAAREVF